jgi:hypothetical protein
LPQREYCLTTSCTTHTQQHQQQQQQQNYKHVLC